MPFNLLFSTHVTFIYRGFWGFGFLAMKIVYVQNSFNACQLKVLLLYWQISYFRT